jgi:hypothetical protein
MRNAQAISIRKPEKKKPLGRPRRRLRIILKWTLKSKMEDCGLDSSGSR